MCILGNPLINLQNSIQSAESNCGGIEPVLLKRYLELFQIMINILLPPRNNHSQFSNSKRSHSSCSRLLSMFAPQFRFMCNDEGMIFFEKGLQTLLQSVYKLIKRLSNG